MTLVDRREETPSVGVSYLSTTERSSRLIAASMLFRGRDQSSSFIIHHLADAELGRELRLEMIAEVSLPCGRLALENAHLMKDRIGIDVCVRSYAWPSIRKLD